MITQRRGVLGIGSLLGWLTAIGLSLCVGQFAPPAEGPVAFRRDMIPLDVEAMTELSQQLEGLARGSKTTTASQRRGVAQLLALALALDPGNSQARELVTDYEQNRRHPQLGFKNLEENRKRIGEVVEWLETAEAGQHGQALAACLKDVVDAADPQQPAANEQGAWAGWIPPLSAYEIQTVSLDPGSTGGRTPRSRVVSETPDPILLNQAQVHTLLWRQAGHDSQDWVLARASLQMSAGKVGGEWSENRPFAVMIGSGVSANAFTATNALITGLLQKHHDPLPAGCRVTITSRDLEQSLLSRKRQSVSAAAAVLASAALTGCEPDAIIIGQIGEDGSLKLPTGFWEQIYALGKASDQRVVMPAEAASSLPSLLALEKISFFLDHEVLFAANFEQLLQMTAKAEDQPVAKTSAKFREIRGRIGSQDIRQYIANRFVRQRLGEILQEAPYHASARMLLLQASGNRPAWVARSVLAAELRRALDPMNWLLRKANAIYAPWDVRTTNGAPVARPEPGSEFTSSEIAKFGSTMDLCRSRIDGLDRYAEKNDRELLEQARKYISTIRALEKATRTRGYTSEISAAIRSACGDLVAGHKQLSGILATEAGDTP